MQKYFFRFLTLLLIPCFVADPVFAITPNCPLSSTREWASEARMRGDRVVFPFAQEAFALPGQENPIIGKWVKVQVAHQCPARQRNEQSKHPPAAPGPTNPAPVLVQEFLRLRNVIRRLKYRNNRPKEYPFAGEWAYEQETYGYVRPIYHPSIAKTKNEDLPRVIFVDPLSGTRYIHLSEPWAVKIPLPENEGGLTIFSGSYGSCASVSVLGTDSKGRKVLVQSHFVPYFPENAHDISVNEAHPVNRFHAGQLLMDTIADLIQDLHDPQILLIYNQRYMSLPSYAKLYHAWHASSIAVMRYRMGVLATITTQDGVAAYVYDYERRWEIGSVFKRRLDRDRNFYAWTWPEMYQFEKGQPILDPAFSPAGPVKTAQTYPEAPKAAREGA